MKIEKGLTLNQVQERIAQGKTNKSSLPKSKSVGKIIGNNIFTLFNFLNFFLAVLIIISGHYINLLFMGIVIGNIIIGIVQEIRSKQMVDKLSLVSAPSAVVMREGKKHEIAVNEVVIDDIILLAEGRQVCADAVVLSGKVEVNQSHLTGESDTILLQAGQNLLSGSFIVSGNCSARVINVGNDNYASKITAEAKQHKKLHSELMASLNTIIKFTAIVIFPMGVLLFFTQFGQSSTDIVLVKTVAGMLGMIPEGLILLTSVALAVGVVRLGYKQTLVQELYCIETLARVDVLCLDKTGTITESKLEIVKEIDLINDNNYNVKEILNALTSALKDNNSTFNALKQYYNTAFSVWTPTTTFPFSSDRKWSGAEFGAKGSFFIGAPEILLKDNYSKIKKQVEKYTTNGYRVLVLTHSKNGGASTKNGVCVALIVLADKIRPEAEQAFKYFKKQGVQIKVISGDSAVTVSNVAKQAGLDNAEKYIDTSSLSDKQLQESAGKYTVFGRVSPQQKKQLIVALKNLGHTVAMTGDGVNDVLALRASDCSIAMAEGSEATRNISQLVLLNSDFSVLPDVVQEGRRVINNIERTASLFLVKTIFSFLLSLITIVAGTLYVFSPIHLTLISGLTVGIPSFFLSIEKNNQKIQGNFVRNVLRRALPGALTVVTNIVLLLLYSRFFLHYSSEQISTVATIVTGGIGFIVLINTCLPFNNKRVALVSVLLTTFIFSIMFLKELFRLTPISISMLLTIFMLMIIAYPLIKIYTYIFNIVSKKFINKLLKDN